MVSQRPLLQVQSISISRGEGEHVVSKVTDEACRHVCDPLIEI